MPSVQMEQVQLWLRSKERLFISIFIPHYARLRNWFGMVAVIWQINKQINLAGPLTGTRLQIDTAIWQPLRQMLDLRACKTVFAKDS